VEASPSPWRQAVDLANMMLCLALRAGPERVYRRALRQFSAEEVTEAFAAARGLALPSQLRRMIRAQGRDLHGEFVRLLPTPPQPIPIQRWSLRRIGVLAVMIALLALVGTTIASVLTNRIATKTPLQIGNLSCTHMEPLWLEAQSVPSARLVPCVRTRLPGWTVADVAVNNSRSVITLDHDRAGRSAVVLRLAAACDTAGTNETPAPTGVAVVLAEETTDIAGRRDVLDCGDRPGCLCCGMGGAGVRSTVGGVGPGRPTAWRPACSPTRSSSGCARSRTSAGRS
jgi:hypothetical protein